jgi:transcriptional regulator with XRE-family HTH domain
MALVSIMLLCQHLTEQAEGRVGMTRQGGWPDSGFGRRLKEIRESKGMSQQQLADKAACRSETVSRLERGEQEPAWPLVKALANALGVSCLAFENADETEPPPDEELAKPRKGEGAEAGPKKRKRKGE